ncbi:MAG: hypothetical protein WD766_07455, partial [Gemmatimonadota bacterium]
MMMTLSATLLTLLLAGPQLSDTTITIAAGTRLDLHTQGGEIVVDTWERNEVRIQAIHGIRDNISVTRAGDVVRVRADSRRGAPGIVDYRVTAPAAMDLDLGGLYADI